VTSERIIFEGGNTALYTLCQLIVATECGKYLSSYCYLWHSKTLLFQKLHGPA